MTPSTFLPSRIGILNMTKLQAQWNCQEGPLRSQSDIFSAALKLDVWRGWFMGVYQSGRLTKWSARGVTQKGSAMIAFLTFRLGYAVDNLY